MPIADRLRELNLTLPPAPQPLASYVPAVQTGNLLVVSGQVPLESGRVVHPGKLGAELSVEQGQEAARLCVLNGLAAAQQALGSLDRVRRVVRLVGYVASAAGFSQQPAVVNGASDLLAEIFGEAGRHARVAIGVNELPLGCAVEIEFLFEVAE
ncbi:MAG TPA: RidA family protein [Dehalococcoidia bacterium]|jgi:enamine deaminase RidA (YjgF/YER057c/UK114 family)